MMVNHNPTYKCNFCGQLYLTDKKIDHMTDPPTILDEPCIPTCCNKAFHAYKNTALIKLRTHTASSKEEAKRYAQKNWDKYELVENCHGRWRAEER
jgi:hypothetical protein